MADTSPPQIVRVRIWDLATRLFHWVLVALLLLLYVTAEFETPDLQVPAWAPGGARAIPRMTLHIWCGYSVLTLVLFRLVWGFMGTSTARFANFVRGPAVMLAYGRSLFGKTSSFVAGHNPLGGAMIVLMLAALAIQTITGLFTKDEDDYFGIAVGPLNGTVSESLGVWFTGLHHYNFVLVETLVIIHILANLYYWLVRRDNLIAPMFTGTKILPPQTDAPQVYFVSGKRALAVAAIAAAVVWSVVTFIPR